MHEVTELQGQVDVCRRELKRAQDALKGFEDHVKFCLSDLQYWNRKLLEAELSCKSV
jgi:hypothetical protein